MTTASLSGISSYVPRPQFEALHARRQKRAILVCHRRSGKTAACLADLVLDAMMSAKRRDYRGAFVAPLRNQAKDIAWQYLRRFLADVPGTQFSEAELRADLPHGARITLYGADIPDRLRGLYLDGVVMDEYPDMPPGIDQVVQPLLADRNGWAIYAGTPKGRNHFYHKWRVATSSGAQTIWYSQMLRASESGILAPHVLQQLKAELDENQYEQEMECSFESALVGAYYAREMADALKSGRLTAVRADPALPVQTAWDLGHTDDTAIWWYQVSRDQVRVLACHASNGHGIDYYGELVRSMAKKHRWVYGTHHLPHDARARTLAANGRSVLEQLIAEIGRDVSIVPRLSVQDGIQAVRKVLPRCWFNLQTCDHGLEALRAYQRQWNDSTRSFESGPRHDWTSHLADAFRMLAVAWKETVLPAPPKEEGALRGLVVGRPGPGIVVPSLDELWAERNVGGRARV